MIRFDLAIHVAVNAVKWMTFVSDESMISTANEIDQSNDEFENLEREST